MQSIYRARWYLQLGCLLMANLVYSIPPEYLEGAPSNVGDIDNDCWDTSSQQLVEMRRMRVEVSGLWEFMMFLKHSTRPRNNEIFRNLHADFWNMYIDCVLSKSHGLGRRQLLFPETSFTHSQKTSEGSRARRQANRRDLRKMIPN